MNRLLRIGLVLLFGALGIGLACFLSAHSRRLGLASSKAGLPALAAASRTDAPTRSPRHVLKAVARPEFPANQGRRAAESPKIKSDPISKTVPKRTANLILPGFEVVAVRDPKATPSPKSDLRFTATVNPAARPARTIKAVPLPAVGQKSIPTLSAAAAVATDAEPTEQPASQPPPTVESLKQELSKLLSAESRQAAVAAEADEPTQPLVAPEGDLPSPNDAAAPSLEITGEGDDHLTVYIQDEDLRKVLSALSVQGNLNILASKSVSGTVSASLSDVSVDTALDAILRSTGYVAQREGKFIYVGTPDDFSAAAQALDTVGTRIYRPNYTSAVEIKKLITPLLSPLVGKAEITSPPKSKIPADDTDAEGDAYAGGDTVLVQDYEAVLAQIDQIVAEVDRQPVQVAIEAMILSVKLDDGHQMGVDFQFLRQQGNLRVGAGVPMADIAQVNFNDGGLKFGFLDSNLGSFLHALETIGDTNVIATPRLMVLNKHRAEILIGAELGYVSTTQTETSSSQTVEFLEVGAQLRIRPFVSHDGMIRMEIHPELSTGSVRVEGGFTLPDKEVTKVTTNIMVPDASTVIIGGLMREDLTTSTTQLPILGSIPIVGALFRTRNEQIERREILVLVTPRIVDSGEACREGAQGASEFHRRQAVFADEMSPHSKPHLGRKYFRMAQAAWSAGDVKAASRYIERSIHFDPSNRAAIDLRSDIAAGSHAGDHSSAPGPQFEGRLPLDEVEALPSAIEVFQPPVQTMAPADTMPSEMVYPVETITEGE